jgi:hypothetical protein
MAPRKSFARSRKSVRTRKVSPKKSRVRKVSPKRSRSRKVSPKKSRVRKVSPKKSRLYRFDEQLNSQLIQKLNDIRDASIVKNEINKLITEILSNKSLETAISESEKRLGNIKREKDYEFNQTTKMINGDYNLVERCVWKILKGHSTYSKRYFEDGNKEALTLLNKLKIWVLENGFSKELHTLLNNYGETMKYEDLLFRDISVNKCIMKELNLNQL